MIADSQWDLCERINTDTAFAVSNNQRGQLLNHEAFSFTMEDLIGMLGNCTNHPQCHDLLPIVQNGKIGLVWRDGDLAIIPEYDMLFDGFDDTFLMAKGADVYMVSADGVDRKLNASTQSRTQLVNKDLYMINDPDTQRCVLVNRDHEVLLQTEAMMILRIEGSPFS